MTRSEVCLLISTPAFALQSHISENIEEVKLVEDKYKKSYANVYDDAGLLTKKVCIYFYSTGFKNTRFACCFGGCL